MLYKLCQIWNSYQKKCIANTFTQPNAFIHVKCLIAESYLGLSQNLSWDSLWCQLTTESH